MKQKIKFPRSEKVYLSGSIYPDLRVAMRKVEQIPSTTFVNEEKVITPNPDIYIYDTSGPFSDPAINIDLKKGLPRLREPWILSRGDVEQLPEITSEYGRIRRNDKSCLLYTSSHGQWSAFVQDVLSHVSDQCSAKTYNLRVHPRTHSLSHLVQW